MFPKSLFTIAILLSPAFAAATPSDSQVSILSATVQNLRNQNQALESRLKDLENKLTEVSKATSTAQTTANNAATAAATAQNTAHSASFLAPIGNVSAHHGGCSGVDTSSPACHAASHRYCVQQGFTSGLIVEFDGSAVAVTCFR